MPYTGNVCDGFAVAMTGLNDLEENIRLDQGCRVMVPQIVKAMGLRPCSLQSRRHVFMRISRSSNPPAGEANTKTCPW
jgi:hypothetical protein